MYGLPAIADDMTRLARGMADSDLLARLDRRLDVVNGRGACRHPDGAVNLVRSALAVFEADAPGPRPWTALSRLERTEPYAVPGRQRGSMSAVRILIDPVACDAYGYCAELLPEAITLDEWGYPVVDGKPLPPELAAAARRAARDCPRRAITLRERPGGR